MTKTPSHNVNSTRFRPHAHAMLEVNTMYMTYMHATNTCKDSKLKNSNNFDPVPKNLCYHREHRAHGHQLRHYHSHRSSPDATMTPTLLAYTNTDWASARTPGDWRRPGFCVFLGNSLVSLVLKTAETRWQCQARKLSILRIASTVASAPSFGHQGNNCAGILSIIGRGHYGTSSPRCAVLAAPRTARLTCSSEG